jgi:hypothetical protein
MEHRARNRPLRRDGTQPTILRALGAVLPTSHHPFSPALKQARNPGTATARPGRAGAAAGIMQAAEAGQLFQHLSHQMQQGQALQDSEQAKQLLAALAARQHHQMALQQVRAPAHCGPWGTGPARSCTRRMPGCWRPLGVHPCQTGRLGEARPRSVVDLFLLVGVQSR